ncbi:MAG: translation initiation factor IF-3 [Longimicrobiales bacterium]|nr:translation initiation factor IF-3 [Longimicrobiales bacterium]
MTDEYHPAEGRTRNRTGEDLIAKTKTRVNEDIRISPIRLIDQDGEQVGIVPLDEAREKAAEAGLDLVEVAPRARPPVVRIMDWGKYQYEQQKAAKEAKKKQHTYELKEVKFRPKTDDHDMDFKVRNARRFLKNGKHVRITVRFRRREMRRPENGQRVLDEVAERLEDVATVASRDRRLDGRTLQMTLEPDVE